MDERRTVKLGETYQSFAEAERRVIPIISKCLDGMIVAAKAVDERRVGLSRTPVPPPRPGRLSTDPSLSLPGFGHRGGVIQVWLRPSGGLPL